MVNYRTKQTNAQTLSGMAMVLVLVAIAFVVIGVTTGVYEMAIFGAVILGVAVVLGIVGAGMHAFRR
jgi:hypothetical protein